MLLNLRKQNFGQVIGLQTTLARPETLEVQIIAVGAEGIGARRQDGQENMRRPIAGIKKLLDGLGEGCTDRKAPVILAVTLRQANILEYSHYNQP